MRIQAKMLLIGLLLILLLLAGSFALYQRTNLDRAENRTLSELQILSEKLALQLELLIQQNEIASLFLLSDSSFLMAVNDNMMPGRQNAENQIIVADSANKIRQTLRSYAVLKHLCSVTVFNLSGDYFTSDYQSPLPSAAAVREVTGSLPWVTQAEDAHGRLILLSPYLNPWKPAQAEKVYGTVRAITTSGGEKVFLLIQRDLAELDRLFNLAGIDRTYAKILRNNSVLFYEIPSGIEKPTETLDVYSEPNRYGLKIQLQQDIAVTYSQAQSQAWQILAFSLAVLLISIVYLYLTSRRMTRPLRVLQDTIEHTAFHNFHQDAPSLQGDEFKALALAFQDLMSRLKTAMDEKILATELEAQSRMDALQAQVNPHFLYNTLTVLANHAMKAGDQEALDICENIVSMLRYSTSTKTREATVKEEVLHVQSFLQLMGKRYQHRLSFQIDVEEGMMDCRLPKIVLQPLAENALKHGFVKQGGQMNILLQGHIEGNEGILFVKDNGTGFDSQTLERLNAAFDAINAQEQPSALQMPGSGLGLANTCMRLKIFFEHSCTLRLFNTNPGAMVCIRFPLFREETI